MRFLTSCASLGMDQVDALNTMTREAADITRQTFLKHVDRDNLREVEAQLGYEAHPRRGLTMAGDWHVSYHKSTFEGKPCVYFVWSAFEYIFV